ncbi:MAG: glycosyltransferase [Chloroflexota bacterium]|nr:glycosyltransferase [Chloroflexota bacterium]
MTHILIAYKQFPAPSIGHAGGQSVYRLLEWLHQRGYQVTLVARIRQEEEHHLDAVRPLCQALYLVPHHGSSPGPRPLALLRSYWALRQATIRALQETHPDLLHVEFAQTAVALWGIKYPAASFRAHDVNWFMLRQRATQSHGVTRWVTRLGARFFRAAEPWLYRQFDLLAAISQGDRKLLAPACAPHPVLLLPLAPNVQPCADTAPAVTPGANILFVGSMSREYNIQGVQWFLAEIWPHILAEVSEARFYIVGSGPPPEIRARADGKRVFVTGFVEELAPWYAAADVFVSPLLVAGGLLQKVLDALAMGKAVVATPGSNHGLGATPGKELLIADQPAAFAEAVVTLLRDSHTRDQLAAAGERFIATYYNPAQTFEEWEQALLQLLTVGGRQ